MTENEALFRIKDLEYECMNSTIHYFTDKDIPMLHIAIKALEEIQQYRAIGTVEEFKALKEKEERFDRNIRMFNEIGLEIRAKAIDEFAERLKDVLITDYSVFDTEDIRLFVDTVEEIAEQMKAGAK